MARTALVLQGIAGNAAAQLADAGADQANGNNFVNDGRTELHISNGDASSRTVTIQSVSCSHGRTGNIVQAIAAGKDAVVKPLDTSLYNQSDGTVSVDWSAGTPSTVRVTATQRLLP